MGQTRIQILEDELKHSQNRELDLQHECKLLINAMEASGLEITTCQKCKTTIMANPDQQHLCQKCRGPK